MILQPFAEDYKRDLERDLATCDGASEGPWDADMEEGSIAGGNGGCVCHLHYHGNVNTVARTGEYFSHANARFIAASRMGWPTAIRLALHFKKLCEELERRGKEPAMRPSKSRTIGAEPVAYDCSVGE